MIAINAIDKLIPVLSTKDTVGFAIDLMTDARTEHLALVESNVYKGIISLQLLEEVLDENTPLNDLPYELESPFVKSNTHVFEVFRNMNNRAYTVIPVLNGDNSYQGSVSLSSLFDAFSNFGMVSGPGGILILEIQNEDYSLSEISRVIESNTGKILAATTYPSSSPDSIWVVVKTNITDLTYVLATLERYKYKIIDTFHQAEQVDHIKERYDLLMKYLSV